MVEMSEEQIACQDQYNEIRARLAKASKALRVAQGESVADQTKNPRTERAWKRIRAIEAELRPVKARLVDLEADYQSRSRDAKRVAARAGRGA